MIDSIWQFVLEQLSHNQFVQAGFLMTFVGSIAYKLREIPNELWNRIVSQLTINLTVHDRDDSFKWIVTWLIHHPYTSRSRLLTCVTSRNKSSLIPSPGWHWFFYKRRLVFLTHTQENLNSNDHRGNSLRDTYTITFFTRNRDILRDMLQEAQELHARREDDDRLTLFYVRNNDLYDRRVSKRRFDTVVLPESAHDILEDATLFFNSKEHYAQLGVPHRRGYLFTGSPGNGKSSFALALASTLGKDLVRLSLSSVTDDESLQNLVSEIDDSILLIEDVDCLYHSREDSKAISFSGFINAIDGVGAGENRLLIMTTNHPERLDPALVRPGRVDRTVEFANCTEDTARAMFRRFHGDELAEQFNIRGVSHANLQKHLMQYSATEAIQRIGELREGEDKDAQSQNNPRPVPRGRAKRGKDRGTEGLDKSVRSRNS